MYRIAQFEKRNPLLWGAIGAACASAVLHFMDVGVISIFLSFAAAYALMFIANLVAKK